MTTLENHRNSLTGRRVLWVLVIVLVSFAVRMGTAHFVAEHLQDAGWFQFGSYAIFDERAQGILDGEEPAFFLTEASRTDLIQYPPAFPVLIGIVYTVTGERSAYAVHRVQWPLDAVISPILILGIAVTVFGWRAGSAVGLPRRATTASASSPVLGCLT